MTPKTMRAASFDLSDSRKMCCHVDLKLIDSALNMMHGHAPDGMAVVQLGAGSGTMALMVMANLNTRMLVTIDHEQQALNWEEQVLKNCGWTGNASENGSPGMPYYTAKFADSTYPGVKQAADEFFGREADTEEGWSGLFFNELTRHV